MGEFEAVVESTDDGDHVIVSTCTWLNNEETALNTPIRIVSADNYREGVGAYLTIEAARQHIKHVQEAIEFLES